MTALHPTRTRLDLLRAIDGGTVTLRQSGAVIRAMRKGGHHRVDGSVREMRRAGWVRLGDDGGTYELTGAGRAVLDGAS